MRINARSIPISVLFLLSLSLSALAQGPRVFTAPQVVAGRGLGFEFVTVITFQNPIEDSCTAEVLLHRGPGQEVGVQLLANGLDFDNPLRLAFTALTTFRLRITAAAGEQDLFQGAARITDECGRLSITAGYDIVPAGSDLAQPSAESGTPPEIFNYNPFVTRRLRTGVIGRAPVDVDPMGVDGLPNVPGIALAFDPELPVSTPSEFCSRVFDGSLLPATDEVCIPLTGAHFTANLDAIFPRIPTLSDATWEFFIQGPPEQPIRADALAIEVTPPNQFRGVPITIYNPACDPINSLCLSGDRFEVKVVATSQSNVGQGSPTLIDDSSGLFFFPQLGNDNFELLVNVLNGCSFNQHFWVFAASNTDVGYTITVTDTQTSEVREYVNQLGNPAPAITDTTAFATCP